MRTCTTCKQSKPDEEFDWKNKPKGKRKSRCKVCRAAWHRQWYRDNCEEHKAKVKANRARTRAAVRKAVAEFKSDGCYICDEKEICCLVAHHIDSTQKKFAIGSALTLSHSVGRVRQELAKCLCLCANCHRKLHAGKIII